MRSTNLYSLLEAVTGFLRKLVNRKATRPLPEMAWELLPYSFQVDWFAVPEEGVLVMEKKIWRAQVRKG